MAELLRSFLDHGAPLLRVQVLAANRAVTVRGRRLRARFVRRAPALVEQQDPAGPVWLEDCEWLPKGFAVPAQQAGLRVTR